MSPADSLIGRTLGHYCITRLLGKGGMGEVYLARDERLGRLAAIKVLRREAVSDPARRQRFLREAKSASALNHPNIITVYDAGSQEGIDFIAMEYVEGEPLNRLIREGLPVAEAVGYARQIAAGLAAAHEAGLIHRDLKPANIMVTRKGQLKLLDFGLAKLTGHPAEDTLASTESMVTEPGVILGTVAYMSPEQAAGKPADARSDIFAFGSVLYEMVTGRRAFAGQTDVEILGRVLQEEPRPAGELTRGLPQELERVIDRCLRKDPERRSQHMGDVKLALEEIQMPETAPAGSRAPGPRRWIKAALAVTAVVILAALVALGLRSVATAPAAIGRVAVLPFDNISGDAEQDYFADGMTEELIGRLGGISALHVTSRTSVMGYKGENQPSARAIAAALGVDALIDGSAVRLGDQVRVRAQLIDARTDEVLWSASYDRPFTDTLVLQSEIAQVIAEEISVAVTPDESKLLSRAKAVDSEAYEYYLRGQQAYNFGPSQADRALEYYELALDRDPDFAPAHTGIASVWAFRGYWGLVPWREGITRAREQAALALPNDDATAIDYAATLALYSEWDWSKAQRDFQRAIELDGSDSQTKFSYGLFLTFMGREDEARAQFRRARELDPLNATLIGAVAVPDLWTGRYQEAVPALQESVTRDPGLLPFHNMLWGAFANLREFKEALREATQFHALLGNQEAVTALAGAGAGEAGYRAAMHEAAEAMAARSRKTYVSPAWMAQLYANAGETEATLDWLERAFEEGSPWLVGLRGAPAYAGLRNEPRFQEIVRRMNFPQSAP